MMMANDVRDRWKMIQGDSTRLLRDPFIVEDGSVDMVITDPPYSSGGLFRGDRAQPSGKKYLGKGARHADFAGDTMDQRSWYRWCTEWLSSCHRALRDGGYCLSFIDWRQAATLQDAFQSSGFLYRGIIPWDKLNARSGHNGFFPPQAEFVVWGTKGRCEKRPPGSPRLPGVLRCAPVHHTRKRHQTEKPVQILTPLMEAVGKDSLILDPFAGSGSTGVAALQMGHRFTGLEMAEGYFDTSVRRLTTASQTQEEAA